MGIHMKIGIVSCYYHPNYGSMLQAYATQRAVEKLGYATITFAINRPVTYMTQSRTRYLLHKIRNRDIFKTKLRRLKSDKALNCYPGIMEGKKIRKLKFEDFYKSNIHLSPFNSDRQALRELSSTCDAVLVGSDMLWHPVNVEHDYYTLTFVPDSVKKISYATSIGTTQIPQYQVKKYQEFLTGFHRISVREQSGVDVIKKLGIDKKVEVVLDPTLLFTAEEWMEIQENKPVVNDQYILCYFLGRNEGHRKFANALKQATGYKIVALKFLDEFVEKDVEFGDLSPFDIGPGEFINLIRNAEYVCTDSFHGTCFSILHHKIFFTMNRFSDKNSQSTNTRLDSLLKKLNLENRRITSFNDDMNYEIKRLLGNGIAYEPVDRILQDLRQNSFSYLQSAIEAEGSQCWK